MHIIFLFAVLMVFQGCSREKPAPQSGTAGTAQQLVTVDEFLQAAHDGVLETVKQGLEAGMDCNATNIEGRTALMMAAFNGHLRVVECLIAAGAKVNAVDFAGRTALMYASTASNPDTVRFLLSKGAKVDAVDLQEHWTALMFAAAEGQADIVRILLENGAERGLKDVDGDSAVQFAIQRNHKAVVEILQAGARP